MLGPYRTKRNLKVSGEPAAEVKETGRRRYVVHEHHARNLHYDLRIEMDGVLRSWAVPKGPPLETGERRLAVQVDDHPVGYIGFEGIIPKGQYGAGEVIIWDNGTYEPVYMQEHNLEVIFHGEKLRGRYALVHMQKSPKNWLFIKLKEKERSGG